MQLELNKQHEKFVTITEESESKAEAKNKKSPNRKMTRLFSNLDTVIVEPKKAKKKTLAQIVTEQDSHP